MYPKIDSFIKFLNLTSITGKRDGSTNSEVIFPDGLLSAGDIHDELYEDKAIKRLGKVDLGTLSWTYIPGQNDSIHYFQSYRISDIYGDADTHSGLRLNFICSIYNTIGAVKIYNTSSVTVNSVIGISNNSNIRIKNILYDNIVSFKQAMSGVYLYYELANPITYTLDNPLDLSYKVDDFGTESILGANVSTINTTKFNGNIKYALNAADTIRNLQTNYVSTYENQGLDEERKSNARKNIGVDGIIDKADKSGIYPDLVAGNLVDEKNTGSSQVIMGLRTSCGTDSIVDDGYAQIKRIKGSSIVWNQLCLSYIFDSNLLSKDTTITTEQRYIVKNTVLSPNRCIKFFGAQTNGPHKIYIKMQIKSDFTNSPYLRYKNKLISEYSNANLIEYVKNKWCEIKNIYNTGADFEKSSITGILPNTNNYIKDEYISFKNVENPLSVFDLTQMFGEGNEPSTVEEFDTLFPLSYKELKNKGDT